MGKRPAQMAHTRTRTHTTDRFKTLKKILKRKQNKLHFSHFKLSNIKALDETLLESVRKQSLACIIASAIILMQPQCRAS